MIVAVLDALLRPRSPLRLSLWRMVFLEEAGMGLVPARAANAASERTRPRWDQAVSAIAAVMAPDAAVIPAGRRSS